jgi:hypothetical protein
MRKYLPAIVTGFVVTVVVGFLLGLIGFHGFAAWYVPLIAGLFTGYIMANLQGTKAGPAASEEQKAAVLAFRPSPGKALIIVHRQGFVGKAAGMEVALDDRVLGQLKSPQFTAVEVDPGAHTLSVGFVGLAAAQNKREIVQVTVVEGQVVAYRATISMGMGKNTIKVERDDDVGTLADDLRRMKMVAPATA